MSRYRTTTSLDPSLQVAFPTPLHHGYNAGMNEEWELVEGPGSMEPYRTTIVCNLGSSPNEADPLTTFIVAAVAVAFAAFCIWLTVRIVNRERWAIWTFAIVIGVPALYVLSSGPMQTVAFRSHVLGVAPPASPGSAGLVTSRFVEMGEWWPVVYGPLLWASDQPWGDRLNRYWDLFPFVDIVDSP